MSPTELPVYVIWVADTEELMEGPVRETEELYLRRGVLPALQPVDDDFYRRNLAPILGTLARWSYVVLDDRVFWLIEWDPGLLVVELGGPGKVRFVAVRSPIPEFGRRSPQPLDLELWDEAIEDDNRQYRLVFDAWDAQFDSQHRKCKMFEPILKETRAIYVPAVESMNDLEPIRWPKGYRPEFGDGIRLDREGFPVQPGAPK